jgi:hypothetical protein
MIVTNKLYRKDFNQYSKNDWKYIFSIYTLRDKYNFTEEEFLTAELVNKVDMLKKMDENLFVKGIIDTNLLHKNEVVFSPCPEDEGCKVIQDFLEDEDVKDRAEINHSGGIPACNSNKSCKGLQDFLGEQTSTHYSLWYYEFKEQKAKRILEIESRLFELKDEHLDLIQELHNIQDDLLVRLNKILK